MLQLLVMQLFTNRFIKDLVLSFFFLLFIYSITHNPVVRPTLKPAEGVWRIEKLQHPLMFGFAGHNYLVLRNANNEIEKEIHGLATDPITNTWKYIGIKDTDLLKVWEFNGPRDYMAEKTYPGKIVFEGNAEETKKTWSKALQCKEEINQKEIYYPPFGFKLKGETENSNSVAYTLLICMGFDSKHIGLITPGEKKNLLDTATSH
jgi:hypothetical protein